ncbi:MAG: GNAT family N-acetyltransferase [Anaerolineae bacterium]
MLPEPTLRRMTVADVPQVGEMFAKIGWDHSSSQREANIAWAGEGSFCLEDQEHVVGTANVICYSSDLAWVGMVVVDPDYQRRGLARRLMVASMDYCRTNNIKTIMLDASSLGYGLYESMNFQSLYKIESWTGIPTPHAASSSRTLRPMSLDDLPAVAALDARLFGLPRSHILQWLQQFGGWVDEQNGVVTGYIFAHAGHSGRIGPWHHPDAEGADALLQSAISSFDGQTVVRLDIPAPNEQASSLAAKYGLSTKRGCTRMIWGETPAPGRMAEQYAIIGFATG